MRRLVDSDKRREQRRQSLLLDRLEARFRGRLASEIARASREIVDTFEATGQVTPPRDHHDAMTAIYQQMAQGAFLVFGGRILEQGKSGGLIMERKEDFAQIMERLALAFVDSEMMRRRITQVTETTRQQIVGQVARGYSDGLGVAEIAKAVSKNVPSISRMRGALIARTETHGAANAGADAGARETGLQMRKEWVSAEDERTRPDHREADGQVIDMDAKFDVGADRLQYPGDPAGSAAQVINCRCAVSHVVQD